MGRVLVASARLAFVVAPSFLILQFNKYADLVWPVVLGRDHFDHRAKWQKRNIAPAHLCTQHTFIIKFR